MGGSIRGFQVIELGQSSGTLPKEREHSVAQLIEIVEALRKTVENLDMNTIQSFIVNFTNVNTHMANTGIHLDGATMKNLLIEIIDAYQAGTLGGGGGGTLVISNRTNLLATTTATHGTIACVQTEGTNMYVWNDVTNKWTVKSYNAYENTNFPSDVDFEIIPGTVLINTTDGTTLTWV